MFFRWVLLCVALSVVTCQSSTSGKGANSDNNGRFGDFSGKGKGGGWQVCEMNPDWIDGDPTRQDTATVGKNGTITFGLGLNLVIPVSDFTTFTIRRMWTQSIFPSTLTVKVTGSAGYESAATPISESGIEGIEYEYKRESSADSSQWSLVKIEENLSLRRGLATESGQVDDPGYPTSITVTAADGMLDFQVDDRRVTDSAILTTDKLYMDISASSGDQLEITRTCP